MRILDAARAFLAYVANWGSDDLSVTSVSEIKEIKRIKVGTYHSDCRY